MSTALRSEDVALITLRWLKQTHTCDNLRNDFTQVNLETIFRGKYLSVFVRIFVCLQNKASRGQGSKARTIPSIRCPRSSRREFCGPSCPARRVCSDLLIDQLIA